jgi:MoaA/NifB/PqqE/SkfB family radical SAM enzyme
MSQNYETAHLFSRGIAELLRDGLRITLRDPAVATFLLRMMRLQRRAAKLRSRWIAGGTPVPGLVIASITDRCNLQCAGCYARALARPPGAELSTAQLRSILVQARDLGVGIVMLAGGEPLLRGDVLDITENLPQMIFPLFTNGLLLDAGIVGRLGRQRHVVPVLSLEGRATDTDGRRGMGVHAHLVDKMRLLRSRGVFYGASITVTRANYATVTAEHFVRGLIANGCRLFILVSYIPAQGGTEHLVLGDEQQAELARLIDAYQKRLPGLFVGFPAGEKELGGCLAAGRGLIHISSTGRVEPCPFSPYSDVSLKQCSLAEALRSPFLEKVRSGVAQRRNGDEGCVLWGEREWVASLLHDSAVAFPMTESLVAAES